LRRGSKGYFGTLRRAAHCGVNAYFSAAFIFVSEVLLNNAGTCISFGVFEIRRGMEPLLQRLQALQAKLVAMQDRLAAAEASQRQLEALLRQQEEEFSALKAGNLNGYPGREELKSTIDRYLQEIDLCLNVLGNRTTDGNSV